MTDDETAAVTRATDSFYAALNAIFTGDMRPMEELWSHCGEVTYMGAVRRLSGRLKPGAGKLAGPARHEAGQQGRAGGPAPDPGRGHRHHPQAVRSARTAEQTAGPNRCQFARPNVFRKEAGVWKMIGHRADPLPFLST